MNSANAPYLDPFSTSQTSGAFPLVKTGAYSGVYCVYGSPYFAFHRGQKAYGVTQGCCNHWDCPRCGVLRAKHEYGRIVVGSELLSKTYPLFFITITCRGRGLSLDTAERNYLSWTNRLLTNMRTYAKRNGQDWYYVQVTEKQKRGHPHSHILTTFNPPEQYTDWIYSKKFTPDEVEHTWKKALRSDWLRDAVISAGLGSQYDLSVVKTAAAASRYVAKYMFKDSMFGTHWPKGWKRVRYSQSFPQLPEKETNAFVLLTSRDWQKLASLAVLVTTDSVQTREEVLDRLAGHDVLVS